LRSKGSGPEADDWIRGADSAA
jgi:hypothetical protein